MSFIFFLLNLRSIALVKLKHEHMFTPACAAQPIFSTKNGTQRARNFLFGLIWIFEALQLFLLHSGAPLLPQVTLPFPLPLCFLPLPPPLFDACPLLQEGGTDPPHLQFGVTMALFISSSSVPRSAWVFLVPLILSPTIMIILFLTNKQKEKTQILNFAVMASLVVLLSAFLITLIIKVRSGSSSAGDLPNATFSLLWILMALCVFPHPHRVHFRCFPLPNLHSPA